MVAEWVDKGKAMGLPAGNIISCILGNYSLLLTNDFDFHLTDELIADRPQERRDGARADAPGWRPVACRSGQSYARWTMSATSSSSAREIATIPPSG